MKKHIKRRLTVSDLLLGAAILLVCVSVGVSIKLDEWRRRRDTVRNSEGVHKNREDTDDRTFVSGINRPVGYRPGHLHHCGNSQGQ